MQKGLCSTPQLLLNRPFRPAQPLRCYSAWHCPPRQLVDSGSLRKAGAFHTVAQQAANTGAVQTPVLDEREVEGMSHFLDSLKWDDNNLVTVIVQHVDTGAILMQAFADRAAISETLQTRLATFYSRSRKGRWCKGETSGHFIRVTGIFPDCDRDSLLYVGNPVGPACHTGAPTCWFSEVKLSESKVSERGESTSQSMAPASTLLGLQRIIQQRKEDTSGGKPSWTARLLSNPELLCEKVREEAGELCQTLEGKEGPHRAASEAADLLYHSLVLLNLQEVDIAAVLSELRGRFGISGLEEKASRKRSEK